VVGAGAAYLLVWSFRKTEVTLRRGGRVAARSSGPFMRAKVEEPTDEVTGFRAVGKDVMLVTRRGVAHRLPLDVRDEHEARFAAARLEELLAGLRATTGAADDQSIVA